MLLFRLITLILLVCSLPVLQARHIQFLYLQPPAQAPSEAYLYGAEAAPVKVQFPKYNFSPAYELPTRELTLRFLPELVVEDVPVSEQAPQIALEAGSSDLLVLVFPNPKNSILPVKFQVLDLGELNFKLGQTLFVNFSDNGVLGNYGESALKLAPRKKVLLSPDTKEPEFRVKLSHIRPDGARYRLLSKPFMNYTDQRRIVFIYNNPAQPRSLGYYVTNIRPATFGKEEDKPQG